MTGQLPGPAPRVLLTGWFSFLHGEATAGDVLAAQTVQRALEDAGIGYDVAWSPVFRPGALTLAAALSSWYTHLVFCCGPVSGEQVAALHQRYASCLRIAVGVSVVDPADPACAGFDLILARDGNGPPQFDLAAVPAPREPIAGQPAAPAAAEITKSGPALTAEPPPPALPVTGVALTTGQGEYGGRRRHEEVTRRLAGWLAGLDCAPLVLETRLDTGDWRLCSTPEAFTVLVRRLDVMVTTRLHGLVLALQAGVPVLAVDPVAGGAKVTAQARAWRWPAVLSAGDTADPGRLDHWWRWCLSADGRRAALAAQAEISGVKHPLLTDLIAAIDGTSAS